jgi:hypothetical protein
MDCSVIQAIWCCQIELRVAGCGLRLAGCEFQDTGFGIRVSERELRNPLKEVIFILLNCKGAWVRNHKDLDIYQLSNDIAVKMHRLTLKLSKYIQYEKN